MWPNPPVAPLLTQSEKVPPPSPSWTPPYVPPPLLYAPPVSLGPSIVLYSVGCSFSAAASSLSFLFPAANNPFRCLSSIPEAPPERWFCSHFTVHSLKGLSYYGLNYSSWEDPMHYIPTLLLLRTVFLFLSPLPIPVYTQPIDLSLGVYIILLFINNSHDSL